MKNFKSLSRIGMVIAISLFGVLKRNRFYSTNSYKFEKVYGNADTEKQQI